MGGKEGSRGYLYQGIAAVLEAVTKNDWDRIYIELHTEHDKVDIALSNNGEVVCAIQVKSTQNSFQPGDVKDWLKAIYSDYKTKEYKLVLIGQCAPNTQNFVNAIPKYYNRDSVALDKTAKQALEGFEVAIFDAARVTVQTLPFDADSLLKNLIAALYKYLSEENQLIPFVQADLLAKALISEQLINSTSGSYTERTIFEQEINKRIEAIAAKIRNQRTPLCIKTFTRGADHLDIPTENTLDLCRAFNGRKLKADLSWHDDIALPLARFLSSRTNPEGIYSLYLEAHTSVAFMAGRLLDSKSGINAAPIQKTSTSGVELWDANSDTRKELSDWTVQTEQLCDDVLDTALILNVTHDICADVKRYIADCDLRIGTLISCSLLQGGGTNQAIFNGAHAAFLANKVYSALDSRTLPQRRANLHIFAAAPNAFMFYLGTVSRGFGKITLYEYDFEQADTCTYTPSITF